MTARDDDREAWHRFVAEMYGSLAECPIERGDQGQLEDVQLEAEEDIKFDHDEVHKR